MRISATLPSQQHPWPVDFRSPDFRALFIRAPAVLEAGPGVEPLAYYHLTEQEKAAQVGKAHGRRILRHQPKVLWSSPDFC